MGSGGGGALAGGLEMAAGAGLTFTGVGAPIGIPMMLAGAGNMASGIAKQQQLNKQDQIAAEGIIKQGDLTRQGEGDVNAVTQKLTGSNQLAADKSAQQLNAYRQAIQQASTVSNSASPNVPGASKAFKAAQASSGASAKDYVNAIASSAATTQGTQLERIDEGNTMAGAASQLGVLQGKSSEQNYVTQLKIRATQQNPWLNAFSQVMNGAAIATSLGGGAGAAFSGTGATAGSIGAGTAASDAATGAGSTGAGNSVFGGIANTKAFA